MLKKHSTTIVLVGIVAAVALTGFAFISAKNTNKVWRGMRDRVMLQLMPADYKEKIPDLIARPFTDDVDIGVVLDADKQYNFIQRPNLNGWNISEDMLYEQALKNLESISRGIKVEVAQANDNDPTAKYIIVELDDGYAAARIVSDNVRAAIARELGDEYVAAIPTRDFLIFWHKDFPLFDAFAKQVEAEYNAEKEYPLSPIPLFVKSTGIEQMIRK